MQLMSSVDVLSHVCGQKADTSSNYCDNIQPYDETFQFLSSATQFLDFFWKLPQIKTYKLCNVVWQHTEGMAGCITWVLLEIYLAVQL